MYKDDHRIDQFLHSKVSVDVLNIYRSDLMLASSIFVSSLLFVYSHMSHYTSQQFLTPYLCRTFSTLHLDACMHTYIEIYVCIFACICVYKLAHVHSCSHTNICIFIFVFLTTSNLYF